MKRNIALILAIAICLTSLVGLTAVAEGETAPSLKIAYYTVPMKATVSILFAVEAEGYNGNYDGLSLIVNKGNSDESIASAGILPINEVPHVIFVYDNLSAAEMETVVTAYVKYGEQSGTPVEYSVKQFADAYLAGEHEEKYETLVSAMIAYGAAVKEMKTAE